jgi:small GTP-binding protein
MGDEEGHYKIVVVGATGVGKTCLLVRLVDGVFETDTRSTIGIEYRTHSLTVDHDKIKLTIWDTAGQERYRSISRSYFRGAVGAILVYALDDVSSFEELNSWINDLLSFASPNAAILLVGNKADLVDDRKVTATEAEQFAARHGFAYLEASALDGRNVAEAFLRLATDIRDRVRRGDIKGDFKPARLPRSSAAPAFVKRVPSRTRFSARILNVLRRTELERDEGFVVRCRSSIGSIFSHGHEKKSMQTARLLRDCGSHLWSGWRSTHLCAQSRSTPALDVPRDSADVIQSQSSQPYPLAFYWPSFRAADFTSGDRYVPQLVRGDFGTCHPVLGNFALPL